MEDSVEMDISLSTIPSEPKDERKIVEMEEEKKPKKKKSSVRLLNQKMKPIVSTGAPNDDLNVGDLFEPNNSGYYTKAGLNFDLVLEYEKKEVLQRNTL